jgi:hypothetical protein
MILQLTILNEQAFAASLGKALQQIEREVVQATARAATQTAAQVQEESNHNAPVVTGRLVRSSQAVSAQAAGASATAEVGYTAPYAAHVHENMEGRKPKFLERAVLAVGPRLRPLVIKELQ